jgi:hypothetical protein
MVGSCHTNHGFEKEKPRVDTWGIQNPKPLNNHKGNLSYWKFKVFFKIIFISHLNGQF